MSTTTKTTTRRHLAALTARLRARGFDGSHVYANDYDGHSVYVKCSQCQALVINGTATHEGGCPNAIR